jgi:hypothetical protein
MYSGSTNWAPHYVMRSNRYAAPLGLIPLR